MMKPLRLHLPSLLLGGLVSLLVAAAAVDRPDGAERYELEISELTGQRYLLERDTGRLLAHQGDAWVQVAPAPE